MWWMIVACASNDSELEARLAAAEARIAVIEERLAVVDPQAAAPTVEDIQARRAERIERLRALRDPDGAREGGVSPVEEGSPGVDDDDRGCTVNDAGETVQPAVPLSELLTMDDAGSMGRALPHRGADGTYDGFRLSGIRRGSVADRCGVKNGDIIHAVNGMNLDSMEATMKAYNTLTADEPSDLAFTVTRQGERMEIVLRAP